MGTSRRARFGRVEGQTFTLTTEDVVGDQAKVSITYKNLVNDVKPGDTILMDDRPENHDHDTRRLLIKISCAAWRMADLYQTTRV